MSKKAIVLSLLLHAAAITALFGYFVSADAQFAGLIRSYVPGTSAPPTVTAPHPYGSSPFGGSPYGG